jgi:hypothetical protein
MKNFNNPIGNQTRDFPACGAVPEPNVPLHTPGQVITSSLPSVSILPVTHFHAFFIFQNIIFPTWFRPFDMGFHLLIFLTLLSAMHSTWSNLVSSSLPSTVRAFQPVKFADHV